jgi:hypothetical protein
VVGESGMIRTQMGKYNRSQCMGHLVWYHHINSNSILATLKQIHILCLDIFLSVQ